VTGNVPSTVPSVRQITEVNNAEGVVIREKAIRPAEPRISTCDWVETKEHSSTVPASELSLAQSSPP
jgi:hypothetical protein